MECFREVIVENAEISWVSPEIYSSKEKALKAIEDDLHQVESGCKHCALRGSLLCPDVDCGVIDLPNLRFVEVSKEEFITDAQPKKKSFWKRLIFWRKDV